MSASSKTVLGRPLSKEERRISQRGYSLFYLVNGASYMCLTSTANGRLCRRFGPERLLTAVALSLAAVPFAWLAFPGDGTGGGAAALVSGILLFMWLGAFYSILINATQAYFLRVCPGKSLQVPGSIGLNLATDAGAGLAGSALGAALVSAASRMASGGGILQFRLYFLMLLPVTGIALVSTLRLRSNK